MKVTVIRKATFNAAHRLYKKEWSDEKNLQVFGKCSYPNFHGHNYTVFAHVTGDIREETGMVVDLKWLSDLIKTEVQDRFDHRNLNLDTEEFKDLIPTAENIAVVVWNILRKKIDDKFHLKIILHETERNSVEYAGE
jgi:6-pyruvoyltetrahydropterin/6-carboxytetrahydropterin synthase